MINLLQPSYPYARAYITNRNFTPSLSQVSCGVGLLKNSPLSWSLHFSESVSKWDELLSPWMQGSTSEAVVPSSSEEPGFKVTARNRCPYSKSPFFVNNHFVFLWGHCDWEYHTYNKNIGSLLYWKQTQPTLNPSIRNLLISSFARTLNWACLWEYPTSFDLITISTPSSSHKWSLFHGSSISDSIKLH